MKEKLRAIKGEKESGNERKRPVVIVHAVGFD
jgi:hypothetical protein